MATFASVAASLLDGLRLRCPACRSASMTTGPLAFFTMRDACPSCDTSFEPGRGEFTGAMMLGWGFFGMIALMGYFVLHVFTDVSLWVEWAWLLFFAGVFPVLSYRNVKGAWVGLMHAAHGLEAPPETSGRAPVRP